MTIDADLDSVDNGAKLKAALQNQRDDIQNLRDEIDIMSADVDGRIVKADGTRVLPSKPFGRQYTLDQLKTIGKELKDMRKKPGEFFGHDFEKAAFGNPLYSDASTGSSAVAVGYVNDIIKLAAYRSEIYGLCKKVPMEDRTAIYPTSVNDLTYTYRSVQSADVTESAPSFSTVTLTSYDFSLYNGFSKSFVEDNIINLVDYLRDRLADAMADIWDEQIINGNSNPFDGILNASGTNEVTMSSTSFDGLDADELIDVLAEFDTVQERQNLVWVFHPTTWDGVVMKMRNAQGDFLFRDSNVLVQGMPRRLLGYPVKFSNALPTLSESATATSWAILGDFRYALSGERTPMKVSWLQDTFYAAQNLQDIMVSWFRWAFILGRAASFCKLTTAAS